MCIDFNHPLYERRMLIRQVAIASPRFKKDGSMKKYLDLGEIPCPPMDEPWNVTRRQRAVARAHRNAFKYFYLMAKGAVQYRKPKLHRFIQHWFFKRKPWEVRAIKIKTKATP